MSRSGRSRMDTSSRRSCRPASGSAAGPLASGALPAASLHRPSHSRASRLPRPRLVAAGPEYTGPGLSSAGRALSAAVHGDVPPADGLPFALRLTGDPCVARVRSSLWSFALEHHRRAGRFRRIPGRLRRVRHRANRVFAGMAHAWHPQNRFRQAIPARCSARAVECPGLPVRPTATMNSPVPRGLR